MLDFNAVSQLTRFIGIATHAWSLMAASLAGDWQGM